MEFIYITIHHYIKPKTKFPNEPQPVLKPKKISPLFLKKIKLTQMYISYIGIKDTDIRTLKPKSFHKTIKESV